MVRGPSDGRPLRAGRLVEDLPTSRLADAFLVVKKRRCAPNTVRTYRWALGCLERAYPTLPRVTQEIIRFVSAEPLRSGNSRRVLYDTIRDFYAWVKTTEDNLAPQLPPVNFGRRRAGEKRGRRGRV